MRKNMVFQNPFSVIDENNEKYVFKFFYHQGIPIVDYNKKNAFFVQILKDKVGGLKICLSCNIGRVNEGIVSQAELEADQYAVHKMGKDAVLRWLNSMVEKIDKDVNNRETYQQEGFLKARDSNAYAKSITKAWL